MGSSETLVHLTYWIRGGFNLSIQHTFIYTNTYTYTKGLLCATASFLAVASISPTCLPVSASLY